MKRILSIDGGGVLGIIPLVVLKHLERSMGKPLYQTFDLITGSSIGAAIGGALSSGQLSCSKLHENMVSSFKTIFKKRFRIPVITPKYQIKDVEEALIPFLGNMCMSDCKTKFFCTSINYIDGRTHFFKSWENKDGKLNLISVIKRSVSAPLYFGKYIDENRKEVWIDGGCGDMNDPSIQAYIEAERQGWIFDDRVHILSLGCGQTFKGIPFNTCSKFNNAQEISYYLNLDNGGLARAQTAQTHETWLKTLSQGNPRLTYQRIQEYDMPEEKHKLDSVKYIPDFNEIGNKLAQRIKFEYFS